jgi:hypothetical protein
MLCWACAQVSTWTYTLGEKGEVSFKRFDWFKSGGGSKPGSRGPSSRPVSSGGATAGADTASPAVSAPPGEAAPEVAGFGDEAAPARSQQGGVHSSQVHVSVASVSGCAAVASSGSGDGQPTAVGGQIDTGAVAPVEFDDLDEHEGGGEDEVGERDEESGPLDGAKPAE